MVKDIDFWDSEQVHLIRLDADAYKGSLEELAKLLDVSLNQIDTYRSDGVRTLLHGKTPDSGGGGVTEILAIKLKNVDRISFSILFSTAA